MKKLLTKLTDLVDVTPSTDVEIFQTVLDILTAQQRQISKMRVNLFGDDVRAVDVLTVEGFAIRTCDVRRVTQVVENGPSDFKFSVTYIVGDKLIDLVVKRSTVEEAEKIWEDIVEAWTGVKS